MEKGVEIISYVLMPNHFHFLIRQAKNDAVMEFTRNFQISFTKYINKRFERTGPLLQGQFKGKLIEDDEQLLHVHRYIHLNPYASFIVNDVESLKDYTWSSLPEFLGHSKGGFCSKNIILNNFDNVDKYWKFITNQADYQRNLKRIKHLVFD
ncbi:MAG: transposase [Candidatus Delongbacteria bacterium]|nr:transposase [Candidatus Delongbacteria bacterium]